MDQNEDSDYGNLPSSGKRKISPQRFTESTKKKNFRNLESAMTYFRKVGDTQTRLSMDK